MTIAIVVLALAVAVILGLAASKPNEFRMSRTTNIRATGERIAPFIADFHNWASWSPFEKLDPAMTKTFSGSQSGKGAIYEWSGNSKAGSGRMEVLSADNSKVAIKLDFLKPFEAHNTSEFTFTAKPDQTTDVTWAMYGPLNFVMKIFHVFADMDSMMGKDFEAGLAKLKEVSESATTRSVGR